MKPEDDPRIHRKVWLEATLKHLFPNASKEFIDTNSQPSGAKLECGAGVGPLAKEKAKDCDSEINVVRVTSYRRRLLDEDNLCEKYHVDGLRYAGLLPSDAPDKTHIIVTQKKVSKKTQEKTLIELTYSASGLGNNGI